MTELQPATKALQLAVALKAWPGRAGRTPKTEAYGVLNAIHEMYAKRLRLDPDDIVNGWLGRYYVAMKTRRGLTDEMMLADHDRLSFDFLLMLDATRACLWALHFDRRNEAELAWPWISDARYYAGLIHGRSDPGVTREKTIRGGHSRAARGRAEFADQIPRIDKTAADLRTKNPRISDSQVAARVWEKFKAEGVLAAGQPLGKKRISKHLRNQTRRVVTT